jgi:CBS domain-containing membrane protein
MMGKRDPWLLIIGIGLSLWLTERISYWILQDMQPWFVIPMGASAVLLFTVPASPLAQPWNMIGGNTISALCGAGCQIWLGAYGDVPTLAIAASAAVALMFALRCIHPAGGAMALTALLGGPEIESLGLSFALFPVALNSAALLLLTLVFHRLAGNRYPHHFCGTGTGHKTHDPPPTHRSTVTQQDLEAAITNYGARLDIRRGDLEEILARAQLQASRRQLGETRCSDVMSRDLVTAHPETSVEEAWEKLGKHRIKALPVIDAHGKLEGIVTVPDFFIDRNRLQFNTTPRMLVAKTVREIMTREIFSIRADQLLSDLIQALSMH